MKDLEIIENKILDMFTEYELNLNDIKEIIQTLSSRVEEYEDFE